jgi:hypothetical protein
MAKCDDRDRRCAARRIHDAGFRRDKRIDYYAGPQSQRLDLWHSAPIGDPWTPGSRWEFVVISLPYFYGPEIESATGTTDTSARSPRYQAPQPTSPEDRPGAGRLEQRLEGAAADFANPLRPSVAWRARTSPHIPGPDQAVTMGQFRLTQPPERAPRARRTCTLWAGPDDIRLTIAVRLVSSSARYH